MIVSIITPFLKILGAYSFGVWKSIQKILTFASIADGRSSQALKWVVANDEATQMKLLKQAIGSAIKVCVVSPYNYW